MKKNALLMVLYDILFLVITFLIIITGKYILDKKAAPLENIVSTDITALTQPQMATTSVLLKNLWVLSIAILLIGTILIILNWSVFQSFIYKKMDNKKCRLKFIAKFFLLNLVWFLIAAIILALFYILSNKNFINPFTIAILITFAHFTNILYILFEQDPRLRSIKRAISLGIIGFYKFILPYIFLIISFIIISQVRLLSRFIPVQIVSTIYLILILLLLAFIRNYVHTLINEVK